MAKTIKNPKNKKLCEKHYYFCGTYYNHNDFLKAVKEEALHIYKCSNEKPKKISKKHMKKLDGGGLNEMIVGIKDRASDAFNYVKNFDGNITPALTISNAKEALLLCAQLDYVKSNKTQNTGMPTDVSTVTNSNTISQENDG